MSNEKIEKLSNQLYQKDLILISVIVSFKSECPYCNAMIYCNNLGQMHGICQHVQSINTDCRQIFFKNQD